MKKEPLGSQTVDKSKIFFIVVCEQMNEKEMTELEYHLFVTQNELTDLGIKHQLLLTSKRER